MAQGLLANQVELHLLTINTKKHYKPTENIPKNFVEKSHYQAVFKNTNTRKNSRLTGFTAKTIFLKV
jgi:hypothetical protein